MSTHFEPFNEYGQLRAGELQRLADRVARLEAAFPDGLPFLRSSAGQVLVQPPAAAASSLTVESNDGITVVKTGVTAIVVSDARDTVKPGMLGIDGITATSVGLNLYLQSDGYSDNGLSTAFAAGATTYKLTPSLTFTNYDTSKLLHTDGSGFVAISAGGSSNATYGYTGHISMKFTFSAAAAGAQLDMDWLAFNEFSYASFSPQHSPGRAHLAFWIFSSNVGDNFSVTITNTGYTGLTLTQVDLHLHRIYNTGGP